MSLTLAEIKDLLTFGQELGLQQLQTEGLVAIYGQRAVMPAQMGGPQLLSPPAEENDSADITRHYANLGKGLLKR